MDGLWRSNNLTQKLPLPNHQFLELIPHANNYEYILLPLPDTSGEKPVRLESVDLQSQLNTSQNLQERV